MRQNACNNGQDILNWFKTDEDAFRFTESGYPLIEPITKEETEGIERTVPFHLAATCKDWDRWVHFHIQDFKFERIWNEPDKYIPMLQRYRGIISPDFSMYTDMPVPLQQYNHYRNNWVARYCQVNGIKVVPSITFSDERSYSWCFDGLPTHSVLWINTIGPLRDPEARPLFFKGLTAAIETLQPTFLYIRTSSKKYRDDLDKWLQDDWTDPVEHEYIKNDNWLFGA